MATRAACAAILRSRSPTTSPARLGHPAAVRGRCRRPLSWPASWLDGGTCWTTRWRRSATPYGARVTRWPGTSTEAVRSHADAGGGRTWRRLRVRAERAQRRRRGGRSWWEAVVGKGRSRRRDALEPEPGTLTLFGAGGSLHRAARSGAAEMWSNAALAYPRQAGDTAERADTEHAVRPRGVRIADRRHQRPTWSRAVTWTSFRSWSF